MPCKINKLRDDIDCTAHHVVYCICPKNARSCPNWQEWEVSTSDEEPESGEKARGYCDAGAFVRDVGGECALPGSVFQHCPRDPAKCEHWRWHDWTGVGEEAESITIGQETAERLIDGEIKINERDPQSRYYDAGGIEVQDIIKAKLTEEQYQGFCAGNAIKYLTRANFKGDKRRDIEKARFYIEWLCDAVMEERVKEEND